MSALSWMRAAAAALALSLGSGCYEAPQLPPMAEGPATVAVTVLADRAIAVHGASDLRALPGGGAVVLDGQGGRLLPFDAAWSPLDPVALPAPAGHPARLAEAAAGGLWVVDPDGPLRRVSAAGELLESLVPEPPPKPRASHPIALLERGDALWVADREGWLRRLDRASGRLLGESAFPQEQGMRAMVVDLVPGPPGGPAVLAVDALSAAVLSLDEAGEVVGRAGRYGRWAGTLDHPKSAVALQGGALVVADSSLDALQLFWPGEPGGFGLLADADAPLHPDHPLALRPGPDADTVLVLSASGAGARLQVLALAPASLAAAREQASVRRLRTQLGQEHAVASPEACGQCHDGLVQDGRAALDPAGIHHPIGAVADPASGLPLDGDDQLQCATCHTAHGDPASGGFLREGLTDDALCLRCHAEDPHREAQAAQGGGRGHKSGAALRAALAARGEGAGAGCLACHSPHAASGPKLARGDEAAGACLGCHPDQAGGDGDHPVGLATTASHGSAPACAHCHQLVGGVGESLLRSPESGLCSGCHGQSQAVARGGHAALGKRAQGPCLSCHSPHDAARADLLRPLLKSSAADPAGCARCHAGVGSAGHRLGPTEDATHPSLTCESCHDVHDPSATPSCGSCHAEPAAAGGHGQGPGAPQCLTCHPAHRSAPMDRASAEASHPRDAACLACHAPGRASAGAPTVAAWTHPQPLSAADMERWSALSGLRLFDAAGQPAAAGAGGALTCASCHATHGPAPDGADHLRLPGWKAACSACHGPDALLLYRSFHRREARR